MRTRISFATLMVLLGAATLVAQPLCVPRSEGVPPRYEAPNWWNSSLVPPAYNTELDAADWRGAFGAGYPLATSTTEDMQFRALHRAESGKEYLYLSWNGKTIPFLASGNKLYVGFNSGTNSVVITIEPATLSGVASLSYNAGVRVSTGGAFSVYAGVPGIPAWINGSTNIATDGTARIWIGSTPTQHWAVQMRVPLSTTATTANLNDGIPYVSGSNFRMWFEFRAGSPVTMSTPFGYAVYKWPRTGAADVGPFTDDVPATTTWGDFRLNSVAFPPDSGCLLDGVSLDANDIGTTNTDPHDIKLHVANTFVAKPHNHGSTTSPPVQARFRIANWGINPSREDVPNPTTNVWLELPPGRVPAGGTAIAPASDGNITNAYDISGSTATCERCRFVGYSSAHPGECSSCTDVGSRLTHQCLLVELTGAGVTFLNDSVYNNMNFVEASSFSELAEVNLAGLAQTGPGSLARDVYFYVQRFNMPGIHDLPNKQLLNSAVAETPAYGGRPQKGYGRGSPYDVNRPKDERRRELLDLLRNDSNATFESVAARVPTVIVHAYYDTGVRNTTSGSPQAILRKLSSFGYFVMHDGNPDAWRTELYGAELIAPDWYHLHVGDSGVARIRTVIESIGGPPEPTTASSSNRFFFDLGPNATGQGFASGVHAQWSANVGVEYFVRPNTSVEGIGGYHLFSRKISNPEGRFDFCQHIEQFSANLKHYFGPGPLHWFVNGGGGAYRLDPPQTWKWGANAGAGALYDISSRWGIEGVYNYHRVNSSPNLSWSTLQAGLRISF